MRAKVVIFDFDGTLADVAEVIRDIYDEESRRRGWPELTDAQYKKLRKGTIREAMQWAGIRTWQLPGLLRQGRKRFHTKSGSVKLFDGVSTLLRELHKDGWEIYVLSANSATTIREVLGRNEVDNYVHILKRSPLFGKAAVVKKLVKKHGYAKDNVWIIGDEVRDLEAAKKAGVGSVAVAWGLQDESLLKKKDPDLLAKTPSDILKYLKQEGTKTSAT